MKWYGMRYRMEWNQMKSIANEMRSNQMKPDETKMKWNQLKSNEIIWNQMKSMKSNEKKKNQWNQMSN